MRRGMNDGLFGFDKYDRPMIGYGIESRRVVCVYGFVRRNPTNISTLCYVTARGMLENPVREGDWRNRFEVSRKRIYIFDTRTSLPKDDETNIIQSVPRGS